MANRRGTTGSRKSRSNGSGSGGISGVSEAFLGHSAFLKRFIARYLRRDQDIEDVLQEAYLKAYTAEQDKGGVDQPKAFLFSIAKNLALNELNRKSRRMTAYIEECQGVVEPETTSTLETELEANQFLGLYCEAVAALPEQCRRVYLLRKVHGLKHREIAERLNISLSAVEKHLRLGWLSCRDYMRRYGIEHHGGRPVRRPEQVVVEKGME